MTDNSSPLYREDISSVLKLDCDWSQLRNKTLLITGATGLIGTYLTDMFLFLNEKYSLNLNLVLLSRHEKESGLPNVKYVSHDINTPFEYDSRVDFVIHAASNTHPVAYSTQPIETITTNIFGTKFLLDLVSKNPGSRFLFLSSVEIYGNDYSENENGMSETDMGYLDCNSTRAGYCETKRLCESLCQAYISQKNADCVIARLCRCYGPTLKKDDSKALSQFLRNGIEGKDIVLKSKGEQCFSYLYASDAACALIFLLLNGKNGEAYNVADRESNITLKELAELIAGNCSTKVIYDLPDETESKGFSKATRAILDSSKINALGWKAQFNVANGIERTIKLGREI